MRFFIGSRDPPKSGMRDLISSTAVPLYRSARRVLELPAKFAGVSRYQDTATPVAIVEVPCARTLDTG